jgi:hypothetical protein
VAEDAVEFSLDISQELRLVLPPGESLIVGASDKPPIVINVAGRDVPIKAVRRGGGVFVRNESTQAHELAIANPVAGTLDVRIRWEGRFDLDARVHPMGRGGFNIAP